MNNKKLIFILIPIIVIVILGVSLLIFLNVTKYKGTYEIYVELVDDRSPDRLLIVKKDGKDFKDYLYITFVDEENIKLCTSDNPTVNFTELNGIEKLAIKLSNNNIAIAKIVKE